MVKHSTSIQIIMDWSTFTTNVGVVTRKCLSRQELNFPAPVKLLCARRTQWKTCVPMPQLAHNNAPVVLPPPTLLLQAEDHVTFGYNGATRWKIPCLRGTDHWIVMCARHNHFIVFNHWNLGFCLSGQLTLPYLTKKPLSWYWSCSYKNPKFVVFKFHIHWLGAVWLQNR